MSSSRAKGFNELFSGAYFELARIITQQTTTTLFKIFIFQLCLFNGHYMLWFYQSIIAVSENLQYKFYYDKCKLVLHVFINPVLELEHVIWP